MFSTVPGFDRPKASRLSEKEIYVSRSVVTSGFDDVVAGNTIGVAFSTAMIE